MPLQFPDPCKAGSDKVVIGLTDDDQTEPYRYYDDTHCIRHLSPETKAYLKTEYVEQGQLELVCEGVEFISLKHPEPSGENDVDVIQTLLQDLHDTTLEETAYIREIVEDGTYLPIKALCGVNVATETNAGP